MMCHGKYLYLVDCLNLIIIVTYTISHIKFGSIDIFYTKITNNTETPNLIKMKLL